MLVLTLRLLKSQCQSLQQLKLLQACWTRCLVNLAVMLCLALSHPGCAVQVCSASCERRAGESVVLAVGCLGLVNQVPDSCVLQMIATYVTCGMLITAASCAEAVSCKG